MNGTELDALTWDTLVMLDPELNTVLREIQELKIDRSEDSYG
ncbi:MAG: hypothetical protein NUV76_12390 [Candidatus Kuenenia sp.]|nr:hypothetical protein [Candidatus Kuenenia sp.]